jgi:hypothetical protein
MIHAFYDRSSPKAKIDDKFDNQGWKAFWSEWKRRVEEATNQPE